MKYLKKFETITFELFGDYYENLIKKELPDIEEYLNEILDSGCNIEISIGRADGSTPLDNEINYKKEPVIIIMIAYYSSRGPEFIKRLNQLTKYLEIFDERIKENTKWKLHSFTPYCNDYKKDVQRIRIELIRK